jgi:hypothetical protein
MKMEKEVPQPGVKESSRLECTESGCNYVCKSFDELEQHMAVEEHSQFVNNESVYAIIR